MLPTLSTSSTPVRKPIRYVYALLIALALALVLALVLIASPGSAAILQPQTPHHSDTPNATCPPDGQCFADVPSGNPFYEFANRLYLQDIVTGYPCGGAGEPCDAENRPYYRPGNTVTRQQMSKFVDQARRLPGINIETGTDLEPLRSSTSAAYGVGVRGESTGGSALGAGVQGVSTNGDGVHGSSTNGEGVYGHSDSGDGVYGHSFTGDGVHGRSDSGIGVYGDSTGSWSGYFVGSVFIGGACVGCAGPTRIDHPLDPARKYLYHSTVQSPDMKNVYDGNVTTDDKGEAVVVLPDYFEALNRDFRYQLTVVGRFAQAIISQQVKDNRFTIKTDKPNVTVSWQVTGIRQDPYANAHRTPVEQDKPADEQGKYLHPTEWGQPESLGVDYEQQQRVGFRD